MQTLHLLLNLTNLINLIKIDRRCANDFIQPGRLLYLLKLCILPLLFVFSFLFSCSPLRASESQAAKTNGTAHVIVQRMHNLGKIKWTLLPEVMKIELPIANLVYDGNLKRASLYSFKTNRYFVTDAQTCISQMNTMRNRRREVVSEWHKVGNTLLDGRKVIVLERTMLKGARPIPSYITVKESIFIDNELKFNKKFVGVVAAVTGEEYSLGLPLRIERRSYSKYNKDMHKTPYVVLETLSLGKKKTVDADFAIPKGFSAATSVESMMLEDSGLGLP